MSSAARPVMVNLFQPSVGDAELRAVAGVFDSNWLGAGPRVQEFEASFAAYIGCEPGEVQAISSCTEGLHQVVAAFGIGAGDEVVLPSISFVGAAHAVRSTGARVALCDVDPTTLNPTLVHVERVITPATRAILVLHYAGLPGAIVELASMARDRSLVLIEDTAIGLGSFAAGRACGTQGDAGVWSFDAMKMLTTGDGGMVWSRHPEVLDRVRAAIREGVGSPAFQRRTVSSRWWELDPVLLGRHATMNDIAGAIGRVQLQRLPSFLRRRREIAALYQRALCQHDWMTLPDERPSDVAWAFYPIQTVGRLRDRLAAHLLHNDVYSSFRYWPLHRTAMYRSDASVPGADLSADCTLLLPLHQGLSDDEVARVTEAIASFVP